MVVAEGGWSVVKRSELSHLVFHILGLGFFFCELPELILEYTD